MGDFRGKDGLERYKKVKDYLDEVLDSGESKCLFCGYGGVDMELTCPSGTVAYLHDGCFDAMKQIIAEYTRYMNKRVDTPYLSIRNFGITIYEKPDNAE